MPDNEGMTPSHDEIEMRAYEEWLERGCPWGSPETDWFKAEQELLAIEDEGIFSKMARGVGSAVESAKSLVSELTGTKRDES